MTVAQRMNNQDVPLLKLVVDAVGTEVKVRTFDLSVSAYLGGIYLQHMQFKGTLNLYLYSCVDNSVVMVAVY